jgi:Flp pilus assembly protein TadG
MQKFRGQALVEAALVIPVFMLFVVGAVDFGRAFAAVLTATNAAKQAAAYAAQHQADGSTAGGSCQRSWGQSTDVAITAASSLAIQCTNVSVGSGTTDPYGRTPITVTVTAAFTPFTPIVSQVLNLRSVGGTATARGETW